jgi:beta-galactosidase
MYGSESIAGEAFEHWMAVLEKPYVIGDFVWTSLDYLGESGIGRVYFEDTMRMFLGEYPWHQANCGDLDLCGFKRPQSYYRNILWQHGEKIYIFVHEPVPEGKTPHLTFWGWPEVVSSWTWPAYDRQDFTVDVYADCDAVELFLNDVSLGTQPSTREERFTASFTVPYSPGVLRAVAVTNGQQYAVTELVTVGSPTQLRLSPDRQKLADEPGQLSFITVEVTDSMGKKHPQANNPIFFTVNGVGTIAAVGNSNPTSTESYVGNQRSAYRGSCLVVVKTTGQPGTITLRAMADGLEPAETTLQVE